MIPADDLRILVQSRHGGVALETDEEARAIAVADDVGYALRIPVYDWTLTKGLTRRGTDQVISSSQDPVAALAGVAVLDQEAIFVFRDLRAKLTDPAVSRALRDVLDDFEASPRRSTVVLLGSRPELPPEIDDRIVTMPLGTPSDQEYRALLNDVVTQLTLSRSADVALAPPDQAQLAAALRGLSLSRARQVLAQVAMQDGVLDLADLPRIIDLKVRELGSGGLLEYFPAAEKPSPLGGFDRLQTWLDRARVAFGAEARAMNLPAPKGVLLTGVQGCGKSLAARAIARSWGLPLLRLDAGRLFDKYIGESEKNLRRTLEAAEAVAPCVLWIDEIEKAVATGGSDGPDGGLAQRLLGTLLTWMSEQDAGVFLVATANDVFRLPPELLRKGRFDELFFVDLPTDAERRQILSIHLGTRRQDPARIDLAAVAAATGGFSGAELEQVVVGALLGSLQQRTPADTATLLREAASTVPLSRTRAEDIARLREQAAGRFVPVSSPDAVAATAA